MLLAIDIGNTNIVIGVYPPAKPVDGHNTQRLLPPLACWRLSTDRQRTADEYRLILRQLWLERGLETQGWAAVLGSVVAPLTDVWSHLLQDLLDATPLVVSHKLNLGLTLKLERPETVGIDRLADAVAGYQRVEGPVVVVDFGTATTFNVVDGQGTFLGGAIAPGLGTVTQALVERASALPAVEMVPPPTAINSSTIPAIQSGLVYGYVGLVEGLLARIQSELAHPAHVLATGGLGHVIAPLTASIHDYDPWLTLAGLCAIYHLNPGNGQERSVAEWEAT
jgi:type III pantothenate kinase